MVQLEEVAAVFNGKTPSKSEQRRAGHPVLKIRDVDESGCFTGMFESFVDPALAADCAEKIIRGGDTLILNAAHNADYVGSKSFLARGAAKGALATGEWLLIRPNEAKTDARYVHYWSHHPETKRRLRDCVKGIHLYPKDVAGLAFPLPDLPEQKRIAVLLEQADRLLRTRRYALELSDTFLPAAFLQLFGDLEPSDARTVEELAANKPNAIRTGPFGSQLLHSEFTESGVAVLGIDNAVSNHFEWTERRFVSLEKYEQLKRYTVLPGDVIVTIMGTCGRCAIVPNDIPTAINTKHLCCVTLDHKQCLPIYLQAAFLYHPFVRHQLGIATKGSIMDGLNMGIIQNLRIPLPRLLAQQHHFAALVTQHERLRATQREALRQAEHLFQSLLHRAFTVNPS